MGKRIILILGKAYVYVFIEKYLNTKWIIGITNGVEDLFSIGKTQDLIR
jgi:hypothetical protein